MDFWVGRPEKSLLKNSDSLVDDPVSSESPHRSAMVNGFLVPTLHIPKLYHIGSLNIEDRGQRGDSLEGNCLSVSVVPLSWRKIARLGGSPLKEMLNDDCRFLDVHATYQNTDLLENIRQWGLSEKLIEEKEMWRAWSLDEEDDEWRYVLAASEEEAFIEVGDGYDNASDVPGPNNQPGISPVKIACGTDALFIKVMQKSLHNCDAMDYLMIHWAQVNLPELDGVYWTDDHAIEMLSAPRGGIFPDRLQRWIVSEIGWDMIDESMDDESHSCMC